MKKLGMIGMIAYRLCIAGSLTTFAVLAATDNLWVSVHGNVDAEVSNARGSVYTGSRPFEVGVSGDVDVLAKVSGTVDVSR